MWLLYVEGQQGHAAYPDDYVNAARGMALATTLLGTQIWDDGTAEMNATQWQPYHLEAGQKGVTNIMPGEAEVGWNIRFTPTQTPEGLRDQLQERLNNPPPWVKSHPDYDQLKNVRLVANIDSASLPYLSKPGWLAGVAQQAIAEQLGITATLDATGGRTDACFVPHYFPNAEVAELGPPEKGGDGVGGMHATDECIRLSDLDKLTSLYKQIVASQNPKLT